MESRGHRPSMAGKSPSAGLGEHGLGVQKDVQAPALATHPPRTAEDLRRALSGRNRSSQRNPGLPRLLITRSGGDA